MLFIWSMWLSVQPNPIFFDLSDGLAACGRDVTIIINLEVRRMVVHSGLE